MPNNFFIIWSGKWELGVPILDEQHRGAACLINTLFYFIANKHGSDIIIKVMQSVMRYSDLHSFTEEGLLAQAGYPGLEQHKKLHNQLAADLRETIQKTIGVGDYVSAPEVFMEFLKSWWMDHLCGADKEFAPHLRAYIATLPQTGTVDHHTHRAKE